MCSITVPREMIVREAWVHTYTIDGRFDLGFGVYRGLVARDRVMDEKLRFDSWEVTRSLLSESQIAELAEAPEQFTSNEFSTPLIVLESGKVIYGYQVWWRVTANEA